MSAPKLEMPGTLSKVLQLPTTVPFPRSLDEKEDDKELQDRGFVSLAVCSEFTEYSAPIQPFEGCKRLSLVSDPLGQPVVFAIGSDQRLHCLVHINGGAHGWKLFDITPEKVDKIETFDLIEENEGDSEIKVIHIAVAAVSANGTASIHHASFPIPAATLESNKVTGFEPQSIKWSAILNNAGLKKISYLLVGPRPSTSVSSAPFLITAGSEQQANIAATHYTIDPSSGIEKPWQTFAFSRDADKILEIRPAKLENEFGIYVLFEQQGATECLIDLFGKDGEYTNTRLVLAEKCGKIRSMYSNVNPTGVTDLFLASDNGLGFVNTQKSASSVQTFAENVSFKQVVASEAIDQDSGDTQSKFTIFAVSDQDELHYIQGIRTFKGNKVVFENSGLPIRTGIQQISCQFNAQTNASEVLYLDEQGAALKHLTRDPVSTCWRENLLNFQSPSRLRTFPAFVTTIAIKDSEGEPASKGFPVELQSEPIFVTANEKSYTLTRQPIVVHTDSMGQVSIVTPASDTLGSPVFDVTVRNSGKSATNKVYAGQRVIERLCAIKSAGDFAKARSVDGTPVFSDAEQQESKEGFEASAELFKNLPSMVMSLDDNAKSIIGKDFHVSDLTVAFETDGHGNSSISNAAEWLSKKWEDISRFTGDALEWMRAKLKSAFKFAFKVVGKVIRFAFEVAGKVFSAVVDSLETLFPAFTSFLKKAVRAGKEKLMALLGYRFDIARIRKTQEVLIATFKATQTKTDIFMKTNKEAIVAGIDLARDKIDDYIKDKRPPPKSPDGKKSMLAWLFDNPIMKLLMRFNPFSILIEAAQEAIEEEFGDKFRIPDFSALIKIFSETIPEALEAQLANAMRLIDSLMIRLKGFAANPKSILDQISGFLADSFWTIFDAISNLITMFWEVATGVFQQAFELISGVWKIPYVTSIFEYTTGQEYSFLNVTSFVGAALLNMLVGDKDRLPFDVLGRPDEFINNIQDKDLDIRSVFEEAFKKISKAANPHPATINMSAMNTSAFNMVAMNTSSNVDKVSAPSQGKSKQSTGIFAKRDASSQPDTKQSPKVKTCRNQAEYEKAQHAYHSAKQWITTGVGVFRMLAAVAEVPIAFTEAMPGQVGGAAVAKWCSGVGTFCSVFVSLGRILDLVFWKRAMDASEDLKDELDEHFWVLLIGHTISTLTSITGTVCLFIADFREDGESSIRWMTYGNYIMNIGCGADVILCHLIAERHEDSREASILRIADGLEIAGSCAGLLTTALSISAHHDPEKESKTALGASALGSACGDAICSIMSVVITSTSIAAANDHSQKVHQIEKA